MHTRTEKTAKKNKMFPSPDRHPYAYDETRETIDTDGVIDQLSWTDRGQTQRYRTLSRGTTEGFIPQMIAPQKPGAGPEEKMDW